MQIYQYGILLSSLQEDELELVRQWRNSAIVRPYMHFKNLISEVEQKNWFKQLDQKRNVYFVISYNKRKIGVINIKDIDWENKVGEAGIFIGDENFINHPAPFLATIMLMDFAFDYLKLNRLKAKMARDNLKVIAFNLKLGYQLIPTHTNEEFNYYEVNKTQFIKMTHSFRNTLLKMKTKQDYINGVDEIFFNQN